MAPSWRTVSRNNVAYLEIPRLANPEAPRLEMLRVNGRDEKLRLWFAADEGHTNLGKKCTELAVAFRIYGMPILYSWSPFMERHLIIPLITS
jgi:hypothetical protein